MSDSQGLRRRTPGFAHGALPPLIRDMQPDLRTIGEIPNFPAEVSRGRQELMERHDGEVCATVLAAENARNSETVLVAGPKGAESLPGGGNQVGHVPVRAELLALRKRVEFLAAAGYHRATKIFRAQPPVPAGLILDEQVAETVVANHLSRLDADPAPGLLDHGDEGFHGGVTVRRLEREREKAMP